MPRIRTGTTAVVIAPRVARQRMPGELETARDRLTSEYFRDMFEAWEAKGRAVLDVVAEMYPDIFLRVVASHMPKEFHATVTNIKIDRLSNVELDSLIQREIVGAAARVEETQDDPALIQQLEPSEPV